MNYDRLHQGRSYLFALAAKVNGQQLADFALKCGSCQVVRTVASEPETAPAIVLDGFRSLGWLVNERDWHLCLCPDCQTGHPDHGARKAQQRAQAVAHIAPPDPELIALKRDIQMVRTALRDIERRVDAALGRGAAA